MSSQSAETQIESGLRTVATAVLRTVAYADVFDYPLTAEEVRRYLVGVPASSSTVQTTLHSDWLVPRRLARHRGFFTLPGRESIVETRLHRAELATQMWSKAARYGLSIASLPFVRMVAVTGTLAMDNVELDADIDYLVVTAPRRVWLARLLSITFVYMGRLGGVTLCPNYVISLDALEQFERSLFTAHELAQMVPLYGLDVYHQLLDANRWARDYLPNAFHHVADGARVRVSRISQKLKRGVEFVLAGRLGDLWEERESRTKIRRLSTQAMACGANAVAFTPQLCKGHVDDHGSRIREAYAQRLASIGLDTEGKAIGC